MRVWSCALPRPLAPRPGVLRFVEELSARMRAEPHRAGPLLSVALRETRWLGSKDRRAAGDMALGLIRHERALARIDPDPVAAWLALVDGVPELDDPADPVEAYAVATSTPEWLAGEWWRRLGPERAVEHARVLAGRAPVCLRILREGAAVPVTHHHVSPRCVVLDEGANVEAWPSFRDGGVMVQDVGSQRIVERVLEAVPPGSRVLDLCAGAGGKSVSLAAAGLRVQAWDIRPNALAELRKRAARAGVEVAVAPPSGRYDAVLVDAPCSGSGVLRRHPENRWKLTFPEDTQRELLARARRLAPLVVYATCSLAERENEAIVAPSGAVTHADTWWPEEGGTEGFFCAVVQGEG